MTCHAVRLAIISSVTIALGGCTFFRAATFQSDDKTSFKREGSRATLEVYARGNPENCKDGPPQLQVEVPTAFPAAIAGAAATVVLNVAETEIAGYLVKKQKEFTATYNAMVNVGGYYSRSEPTDLAIERANQKLGSATALKYSQASFNCLRLTRTIGEQEAPTEALVWVGSLIPNDSGTALMLKTDSITLKRAAARTDKATRQVDVSVEIKIDATTLNEKGEIVTSTIANKVLAYPRLITPGDETATVQPVVRDVSSSWFAAVPRSQKEIDKCESLQEASPPCGGVSPVTVSLLVTEVGSGGETFGNLAKQIDDNKKTLNDAVATVVKEALTEKGGSGSSK
jgi:hypothetical protein